APSAGAAPASDPASDKVARTPTELGQSTGEPSGRKFARTPAELGQSTGEPSGRKFARTPAELGQSTDEPSGPKMARTPTELGQSTNLSSTAPSGGSSGIDWGDTAIFGGIMLGLAMIGLGGVVARNRRRGTAQRSSTAAVSS
ncbi:MAG: hypothetical protein ACRDPL_19295, partial [Propionibacteriaceae bacterium]